MPFSRDQFDANSIYRIVNQAYTTSNGVKTSIQRQLDTTTSNAQTVTSYTLVLSDAGRTIEMNSASANTLTVPLDSSVAFPTGSRVNIIQTGPGQTTIQSVSGVTLNSFDSTTKLSGQWAAASLIKRAENTWVLIGNVTATRDLEIMVIMGGF